MGISSVRWFSLSFDMNITISEFHLKKNNPVLTTSLGYILSVGIDKRADKVWVSQAA